MDTQVLGMAAAWYLVFIVSVTFHEASHAFAGWRLGDDTSFRSGHVTLDPIPHIKRPPFGMVLVPIISFFMWGWMIGWASVTYDPIWAQRYPKREGVMALAGPAANLTLLLLAAGLIRLGMAMGWFYAPDTINCSQVTAATAQGPATIAAVLLSIMFTLNLVLCAFNLLPLPPLDGSAALSLVLGPEALQRYRGFMSQPAASLIGLIVAWHIFGFVFGPVHELAVNLLYPEFSYH